MQFEYADISLLGHREENQDRVAVEVRGNASLLIVIDGMGGHLNGALAAEKSLLAIARAFSAQKLPILDPQGFMHHAIGQAHRELVQLGVGHAIEARPRATCALCLVQDGSAYWAHVGDSRVYWIRAGEVLERTRDHSHVEVLLQEGLITEEEIAEHPMRNFVECCLGGDDPLPGMTVTRQKKLRPMDVLLACSDGFWSGLEESMLAHAVSGNGELSAIIASLAEKAVSSNAPYSDNTTAAVVSWRPQ